MFAAQPLAITAAEWQIGHKVQFLEHIIRYCAEICSCRETVHFAHDLKDKMSSVSPIARPRLDGGADSAPCVDRFKLACSEIILQNRRYYYIKEEVIDKIPKRDGCYVIHSFQLHYVYAK
jgi:hypothetical protein